MFSGLIGYRGIVVACEALPSGGATLQVRCDGIEGERPGIKDSIAVDGACLTATEIRGDAVSFDVIPETLRRTTLGDRVAGDAVNLEYALRVGDRLGGHFVYGHVDDTARVLARVAEGQGERVRIERAAALAPAIVSKAFIAIDGISLTIAAVGEGWFEVALIPETLIRTTLGNRPAGSRVNVEVDPLARYVAAALQAGPAA